MANQELNISRRDFLKTAVFSIAGLGISACIGVEGQSGNTDSVTEQSLTDQKAGLDVYEGKIRADGVVDAEELENYRREEKSYIQNRATFYPDNE